MEAAKRDLKNKFHTGMGIKNLDLVKKGGECKKGIRGRVTTANETKMAEIRSDMKKIIEAGIQKVNATTILHEKVKFDGKSTMTINDKIYTLNKNVHMVGWGREVTMLGAAFEKIIGDHLKIGWLVVPKGTVSRMWTFPSCLPKMDTCITYLEAGSNSSNNRLPDERSVEATRSIAEYCKKLTQEDILVVILSGGSEDLFCLPKSNIGLGQKVAVLEKLKALGATFEEIDFARIRMSTVRGGGLARLAYPAKVITLIMSDVPGDDVEKVAGGPTFFSNVNVPNIFQKYGIETKLPLDLLEEDHLLDGNERFNFVDHHVIASINDALDEMAKASFKLGLVPLKLSSSCVNYAKILGRDYAKLASWLILAAEDEIQELELYDLMFDSPVLSLSEEKVREIYPKKDKWGLGLAILIGGHSMAKLSIDHGHGGPNQELALYFSLYWYLRKERYPVLRKYIVWFLGCNTTGHDGNTDFAGAYGYDSCITQVYQTFKNLTVLHSMAQSEYRNLLRKNSGIEEIEKARKKLEDLEKEKNEVRSILPEEVLENNDTNSFFSSINDGDELYRFGTNQDNTFTNVRDLHVIRIINSALT